MGNSKILRNYDIVWDYPSFPIDIQEIKNLERFTKEEFEAYTVQFPYYRFGKKSIKRIRKMIKICNAFSRYLERKHHRIVKKRD